MGSEKKAETSQSHPQHHSFPFLAVEMKMKTSTAPTLLLSIPTASSLLATTSPVALAPEAVVKFRSPSIEKSENTSPPLVTQTLPQTRSPIRTSCASASARAGSKSYLSFAVSFLPCLFCALHFPSHQPNLLVACFLCCELGRKARQ